MPGALDIANWIACVISIAAGIFSFYQAKTCREYAKKVTAVENLNKFDEVVELVRKTCKKTKKFDIGVKPESLMGLDFHKDVVVNVKEYTRSLSVYSPILMEIL